MYLNSGLDGEEAVYITSSDGFYQLRGYSIYYERNQLMQDYMIARKDILREESKTDDRAIRDFRKKMDEHRTAAVHQRSTLFCKYSFRTLQCISGNGAGRRCCHV